MSSLGKRRAAGYTRTFKKAKTSAGRQLVAASRGARMSGRYNRSMSARLQRAPNVSRETGFVDVAAATYGLDTTGSVTLLNTVAQGASVNQRVGKRIMLRSLQCRGNMYQNASSILNDVAYLIVYDKRPCGALPTVADILVSASPTAMNNDANSGRFEIMKRVDEVLTGNTTAVTNLTERTIIGQDWYLDLKGYPQTFKAVGTGAIGDIECGALYLVTVGTAAAGVLAATLSTGFRLRFLDI